MEEGIARGICEPGGVGVGRVKIGGAGSALSFFDLAEIYGRGLW